MVNRNGSVHVDIMFGGCATRAWQSPAPQTHLLYIRTGISIHVHVYAWGIAPFPGFPPEDEWGHKAGWSFVR